MAMIRFFETLPESLCGPGSGASLLVSISAESCQYHHGLSGLKDEI